MEDNEKRLAARRVLETCLYVNDLEAAETFYTEVMGMERIALEEKRHLFFQCDNGMFLLFNPEETPKPIHDVPPHGAKGPGHVAFSMRKTDIPHWENHLREKGVAIEMIKEWDHGGISIYFRDPAGNSVELATAQIWGRPDEG